MVVYQIVDFFTSSAHKIAETEKNMQDMALKDVLN